MPHKHWATIFTTRNPETGRFLVDIELRRARRHADEDSRREGRIELAGNTDTVVVPIDREGRIGCGWRSLEEAELAGMRRLLILWVRGRPPGLAPRRKRRTGSQGGRRRWWTPPYEYAVHLEKARRRKALLQVLEQQQGHPGALDMALLGLDDQGRIHCPGLT